MPKLNLAILLGVCVAICSCQTAVPIRVYKDQLKLITPKSLDGGLKLTMLSKAKDVRRQAVDQVGRHTISLLMIPGPTVKTETEHLDEAIANRIREALTSSGFSVLTVDKIDEAKGPVLVVQIDDLKNYLFSWVYPLGLVWGHMNLSLHLVSRDGTELWKANTQGHGGMWASFLYMAGFETRVTSDLTANVNQILEIVSSSEFGLLLRFPDIFQNENATTHPKIASWMPFRNHPLRRSLLLRRGPLMVLVPGLSNLSIGSSCPKGVERRG